MSVVTVSASFGAGGSEVGPAVAAALDVPFVDRAIPAGVARRLGVPLTDAEQKDETYDTGLWRIVSSMALVPDLAGAGPLAYSTLADDRAFREKTEQVLREVADTTGGVILGRAGALVLRDVRRALHIRLDGPEPARVTAAMRMTGRDERYCREELRAVDAARVAYWRHFYRADPAEYRHYHLVIDSTALPLDAVTDLVAAAARALGIGR
ncbi:MAG TPA: cytidylate kinase-like family protein [Mycobacteriales bacterium]|nr:cytidylate kinase-like family protein [Mycobacteriales bacterium]